MACEGFTHTHGAPMGLVITASLSHIPGNCFVWLSLFVAQPLGELLYITPYCVSNQKRYLREWVHASGEAALMCSAGN